MKRTLLLAAAFMPAPLAAADKPAAYPSPSEIVAAAPAGEWVVIVADDLLVMDLAPDAKGAPRRVVIQLMPPPFSQGWVGNVRLLAAAHWWDGLSVYRVQDGYVTQWGDADGEDKAKARLLPAGLAVVPESEYTVDREEYAGALLNWERTHKPLHRPTQIEQLELQVDRGGTEADSGRPASFRDPYANSLTFFAGWPVAGSVGRDAEAQFWPVHCYGMVGVARDLSPDTGTGAELYTVIGHAPRQLDRNIALVGRVIEGMQWLSSLPRGPGPAGFYETPEERTPILYVRLASELPEAQRPRFEYLSTESETFARYAEAVANRRDPFFITPAGGADVCNIKVPVRRASR